VSNEVVVRQNQLPAQHYTLSELERMARAVAASGFYAAKTPEAVFTVMLLAQSENCHPMTAMKEWHIMSIGGATVVSMKAQTMLERFQAAGGVVNWIKLADDGASAKFSHPQGGSVTIEWDIDRATKAGLWGKNMWKTYPRAMFRSRVASEGIRTVFPGVLNGRYTPEENLAMVDEDIPDTKQERIENFGKGLLQAAIDAGLIELKEAETMEELKRRFNDDYKLAREKGDERAMQMFKDAYDIRKTELAAKAITAAVEAKKEEGVI
jgi:hypothetical protein